MDLDPGSWAPYLNVTAVGVPFIATLLLSAVAVGLLVKRLRRSAPPRSSAFFRRRRVAVILTGSLCAVLALASAADAVNTYFGYLPRLGDVLGSTTAGFPTLDGPPMPGLHNPHKGVVWRVRIPGTVSGMHFGPAEVFLPPQYFDPQRADQRFPVLYLLHGSPGVPADWVRGGRAFDAAAIEARAGHPVIVVIPRLSRGWLDDPECVDGLKEKIETYLSVDVVNRIDATLRTEPRAQSRILAGMSAGGFCALNTGLRHPHEFATVLDLSGLTYPSHEGGPRALFGTGASAEQTLYSNSPKDYAGDLRLPPGFRVWMDFGHDDHATGRAMQALAPTLRNAGARIVLRQRNGGHTFHVWVPALRESLAWALANTN